MKPQKLDSNKKTKPEQETLVAVFVPILDKGLLEQWHPHFALSQIQKRHDAQKYYTAPATSKVTLFGQVAHVHLSIQQFCLPQGLFTSNVAGQIVVHKHCLPFFVLPGLISWPEFEESDPWKNRRKKTFRTKDHQKHF